MSQRYWRLGEQITRLTRTLVAVKDWSVSTTMRHIGERTGYSVDTVYRWQQGRSCPIPEIVEILARIGREEAHLGREWGENLLNEARHPDTETVLSTLWGPKEDKNIPCNLPDLEHRTLIGRQKEIAELFELLSSRFGVHLISVDGIGGVGKTALVKEAASRCLQASTGEVLNRQVPTFDAIIFVSAKQQYLTPAGILEGSESQHTLRDIFREIAQTLNRFEITQAPLQEQFSRVRDALSRQRTLLIVDNLETMVEKQEIVAFLYRLPPQVKVVITTRERMLFSPIRLEQLVEEEALNLIEREAQEKGTSLSKEEAVALYRHIGGIPAALVYAIGQLASGYSIETVRSKVSQAGGDVARFCFEGSVGPLRGQPAHHLLIAMAMFSKSPLRPAIAHTAGLANNPGAVEEGLAQLRRLSLISQQEERYGMLPLTREYALAELAAYPIFEQEARERWVAWYLKFVEQYGGKDWKEWHIQFDHIEEEWENLLAVFDWCAAHERYQEMRTFWLAGGVNWFAYIYGYYWDDRLTCLTWIIQAAERRGDWATAVEAMAEKGHTLTLTEQLEEADATLKGAWDLHEHANVKVQVKVAENIARLRTYQKQYTEALFWLNQTRVLRDIASFDETERIRRQLVDRNYHGRIYYEMQDYAQAQHYFREVVENAQSIGFDRGLAYALRYLAEIAISQGSFDEAESLLMMGLTTSERNKDKRRTAFYEKSLTDLYIGWKKMSEVRRWALKAHDDFERLGMQRETEEMLALLQELER